MEGSSKDPKRTIKSISRCFPQQIMSALAQQTKEQHGKVKNNQRGKLLTKREGRNPHKINSKRHIGTDSNEEQRF